MTYKILLNTPASLTGAFFASKKYKNPLKKDISIPFFEGGAIINTQRKSYLVFTVFQKAVIFSYVFIGILSLLQQKG